MPTMLEFRPFLFKISKFLLINPEPIEIETFEEGVSGYAESSGDIADDECSSNIADDVRFKMANFVVQHFKHFQHFQHFCQTQ